MRNLPRIAAWAACLFATAGHDVLAEVKDRPSSPIGKRIESFELKDFGGKTHSLDQLVDKQAVVVVFLGTECPLATLYAPRLTQLSERFAAQGVAFVGINSNQQDSLSEMAAYAKTHALNFPLLKDVGNVVADQFGAVRTPEVFLLDKSRVVRYWGRIDDQYVVGRQRTKATREDLSAALTEVLAGKEVIQSVTEAPGCRIGRVHQAQADAPVTFSKHIAPLLNSRCVECHRPGEIGPFSLTNYDEVAGWAETIVEVVEENRMPPWHANPEHGEFRNDARLSDADKQLIRDWVAAGAPQGNPSDLPAPPKFVEGWRLPRLDMHMAMANKPHEIPAEGTVDYKYYVVDPGFTEDKWIQGAEARAGNRSVVHHIIMFVHPPGGNRGPGGIAQGFLTATAPGADPLVLPEGQAKLIPAGSKLVFQMHYTTNGSPQKDLSSVGLMFADPATVKKKVNTVSVDTNLILIPPRAPDYKLEAWHTFRKDTQVVSYFPHMHVRGKSFRYEVYYPDGTQEILLDVPKYDFNWQLTYELKQPKVLPKGTRMKCVAHYDNSAGNLANPNPDRIVHWGEQTWDEMLMGFMETMELDEPAPVKKPVAGDEAAAKDRQASRSTSTAK